MSPVEVEAWQKLGFATLAGGTVLACFKLLVSSLVRQVATLQKALLEQVRHGDGNGAPSLQKLEDALSESKSDRLDLHKVQAEQGMQLAVLTEQGDVIINRLDGLACSGCDCPDAPVAPLRPSRVKGG